MKWNDYLKLIKSCPDDELFENARLFDNFVINNSGDSSKLMTALIETENYIPLKADNDSFFQKRFKGRSVIVPNCFAYKPGTITLSIKNGSQVILTSDNEGTVLQHQGQQRKYTTSLFLHTDQIKRMHGIHPFRVMATVLEEIVEKVLIPMQVGFSLPRVFTFVRESPKQDYSTIVYWPDLVEEELER